MSPTESESRLYSDHELSYVVQSQSRKDRGGSSWERRTKQSGRVDGSAAVGVM
jgi:hypothetical protein